MTKQWKKLLTGFAALVVLAGLMASCGTSDDDAATAAETDSTTSQEVAESEPEVEPPTEEPTPEPTAEAPPATPAPEPTAAPVAEPASGADISSFEPFPLPDYVTSNVGVDIEFASYFVEVEPGIKVHVLEAGSGYPVYLQHGAPTSGFLYRKVAELLPPDQFRVIMPTMVGLGFSTQVAAEDHTLDNHARWMNEALNQLGLEELIYVGHDWGGPVGMAALERSPELLQGAVLLNTVFGAPTGPVELSPQLQAILAPLPPEAELVVSSMIFDQLPGLQNDPASMPPEVVDLYRRPVAESDNPIGPLAIVRMAATDPEHPTAEVLRAIDAYIAQLDVPAEIVWGVNDPLLGARLPAMMAAFPDAPVTETTAGHFLQEEVDAPEQIAAAITRVSEQISAQ